MVSQPCAFGIPAGRKPCSNRNDHNPGGQPCKGAPDDRDSSQGQGSEPPAWVLTDQLGEPRHRLWHWLRETETWLPLAQAELIGFRRLHRLACRLWPDRPPKWDPHRRAYAYSWREIEALCAAATAEREARWAGQGLRRRGVQR